MYIEDLWREWTEDGRSILERHREHNLSGPKAAPNLTAAGRNFMTIGGALVENNEGKGGAS